jgi:hypothetical protein
VAELAHALAPFAPRRARLSIERVSRVIESAGLGGSQPNLNEVMPPSSRAGTGSSTGAAWGASGVENRGSGRVIALVVGSLLLGGAAVAGIMVMKGHRANVDGPLTTSSTPIVAAAPPVPTDHPAESPPPSVAPAPTEHEAPGASTVATSAAPETSAAVPDKATQRPAGKSFAPKGPAAPIKVAAAPPATAPTPGPAPVAPAKSAKKASLYDDRK